MLNFLDINISEKHIKKIPQKQNKQTKGKYESYDDWKKNEKSQLKSICRKLSEKYGYKL